MSLDQEKQLLQSLSAALDKMRQDGLEHTPEYKDLSEEWQSIAHGLVMVDILGDEEV
jgi:ABC-type amino acid transport substrate-binding protein